MTADLRPELIAYMVADPEAMADIVLGCVRKHPDLEAHLRRRVKGGLSTRPLASERANDDDEGEPLPMPTPEVEASLRRRATLIVARKAVSHPLLVIEGLRANLSVAVGDEALILGGSLVHLRQVACVVTALARDGVDIERAWNQLSDHICEQFGGQLARRSVSRRTPPRVSPPSSTLPADLDDGEDKPVVECLHVITTGWAPATRIRRERQEGNRAFVKRLLAAAREAAAQGDAAARSAVEAALRHYPELVREDDEPPGPGVVDGRER